jgi:hypothetical protein
MYNGILNLHFVQFIINFCQCTFVSCFRIKILYIRFEVLVVVTMKVAVSEVWHCVSPCGAVEVY